MGNSDAKQSDSWDGWNVVPAENSQVTAQWKETADSSNKDWKADGWGAKSSNRSSQRNNPGRPQGDRMRGVHLHQDNGLN